MARATSSSASRLNSSTTSSGGTPGSNSSKESLSEKLAGGRSSRRSTRKRLSLTSETSHSTAASSTAMPLNDIVDATPISPQQPYDRKKKVSSRSDDALRKSRRRRTSVDRKERRHRSRSSSANDELDRKPERNKSFSSDSVTHFEEEASFREATSGFRSAASGEASDGLTPDSKSSSSRRKSSSQALGSSSSRRTPSNGRGRTRRSSTATSPRRSSTATPRKGSLASSSRDSRTPPKSRKRESSKSTSKQQRSSSSKSTRKIRRSSSHEEQSLTSFMKKEFAIRPEETEDALEVKSAYTNLYSRRKSQKHDDDWGLNGSSYHGESARRNTRSFRDEMAARAAALGSEAEEDEGSPYRSRSFPTELQGGGTSSSGNSFRRSLSDDYQQQQGGMTSHPSFTSLPVLKEERKKDKKSSSSSKTKKSSRKSHKKSRSSSRELSGWLNQKGNDADKLSAPLSPVSASRSVVSMPALHSPTASARQRKLPKFSSPGFAKPEPPPLTTQSEHHNATPKRGKSSGNLLEELGHHNKERRARSSSKRRSRRRKSNGSRASLTGLDRSMQDESTSSDVRRRSKSAHKALKKSMSKHSHKEGERPRSLSRNRRVSQSNKERSPPRQRSGATRERKPPGRGRGLQKIFSIRDMRAEIEAGQQQQQPKPLVFKREDTASEWGAPRTPSNSQRLSHSLSNEVPESPLPPLAPHSPIRSDRTGTRSTDDEDSFYSYSHRDRRSSAPLSKDGSGDDNSDYLPKRHSTQVPSMPASILKNRDEEIHQHSNGDRDEEGEDLGDQAFDFSLDYKDSLDNDADLGIEEDVFTHYTWAFNDSVDTNPTYMRKEDAKEERLFLKESIRESLLSRALEGL